MSPFIPALIDIKPGSYLNSINLGSNGVTPVAILGSATFDIYQIDSATIKFMGASVRTKNNGESMISYSDINGDGFVDMIAQFPTQMLRLTIDDTKANLSGNLINGPEFKGSDLVRIIK